MENLNSAEKIVKGFELVGEGVLETFQNAMNLFVDALSNFVDCVNMINKVNHKKPRLPRKIKKKYKKLGIYEDWKSGAYLRTGFTNGIEKTVTLKEVKNEMG
ncbi:MAG: hypothetical protein E7H80_03845 [Thomasclavelia ramosa]|nr:hypothetical protein [Thomasclavelia ramosa]